MRRAIVDLARFPDNRLFEQVSEGIALIVENAISLDESAACLYRENHIRASNIIRGFAEEEAAKVLILIDFVRCPNNAEQRAQVLKHFYGHVAKRIYAMVCSYPTISTFGELCTFVEQESRIYFLDGPNGVDWIFPNALKSEREQALYVDFVQGITEDNGEHWWQTPVVPQLDRFGYKTPDCVRLSAALSQVAASSPEGLAEIANAWREFEPDKETDRIELCEFIGCMLDSLVKRNHGAPDESTSRLIASTWTFPMWSLTINEPQPHRNAQDLKTLREERVRTIEWIEATESEKDPSPAICRSKVEILTDAYARWESDQAEERARTAGPDDRRFRFYSAEDMVKWFELPSYLRLEELYRGLNDQEREALLALGWYARETVGNWPKIYERARNRLATVDEGYQLSLAGYWLAGFDRWAAAPRLFRSGERRHV